MQLCEPVKQLLPTPPVLPVISQLVEGREGMVVVPAPRTTMWYSLLDTGSAWLIAQLSGSNGCKPLRHYGLSIKVRGNSLVTVPVRAKSRKAPRTTRELRGECGGWTNHGIGELC